MSAIAIATLAPATFVGMGGDVQEWRRQRLDALVQKFGTQVELGRRLGKKDGAWIYQLSTGRRPITEKTIEQLEALPGARGWFHSQAAADQFEPPDEAEKSLLLNLRLLTDEEREEIAADVAERANYVRRVLQQNAGKVASTHGVTSSVYAPGGKEPAPGEALRAAVKTLAGNVSRPASNKRPARPKGDRGA